MKTGDAQPGRCAGSAQVVALILCLFAPSVSAASCEDLLSRLPRVFERYAQLLEKQGRGSELIQPSEEWLDDEWIHGPGAVRDSVWKEVARTVTLPESGFAPPYPSDVRIWGRLVADTTKSGDESHRCRDMLAVRFDLPEGSVFFTIGHSAEFCTEVPNMIFMRDGKQVSQLLPEIWGFDIEALWCTGHYLVMNLRAEGEYGGRQEGFAFWNLDRGWIRVILAVTRSGVHFDSKEPVEDPKEGLGVYLRDLRQAAVREDHDWILVKTGAKGLVFWPDSREWTVVEAQPLNRRGP